MRRRATSLRPIQATSRDAFLNDLGVGTPIQLEPLRQYTLGVLSLHLGDTASAAAAGAKLHGLAAAGGATTLVRDLDRGLRARLALQAGKPEEALRLLEELEARDSQGDIAVIPFVARANERYLHGEVLIALGRDTEALRWFSSLGKGSASEIPLEAPSQLRQAEIHERLGHRDEAARHYARLVALWRNADPEFQHFVDVARQRLASLTRRN